MHPHRHSDRPKALTVRLNSASGPVSHLLHSWLHSPSCRTLNVVLFYCFLLNDLSTSLQMVESRGQKYCRVTLGSRQHSTPKRRTITKGIKSIIEWNCVLVYPYSTEKWLK